MPFFNKPCERCTVKSAVEGNRYCGDCRKLVIKEMREAGYLGPVPYQYSKRTRDHKEDTRETKHGRDE